jgi:hypothetical protein
MTRATYTVQRARCCGRDAVAEMRGRLEQVVAEALGSWDESETFVHHLQQLVDALLEPGAPRRID